MIEMTIDKIVANPASNQRVVLLRAKDADRCLPIWIGPAEADSIALKLEGQGGAPPDDTRPDGLDDQRSGGEGGAGHRERAEGRHVPRKSRAAAKRHDHRARLEAKRCYRAGRPLRRAHIRR